MSSTKVLSSSVAAKRPIKRSRFETKPTFASLRDFSVLEYPHPYGLLPSGNRLLDKEDSVTASSPTRLLSDECWYAVLEFCDGPELSRLLQTCRYFYAIGSEPELWRDLVLRKHADGVLTHAGPSWKDTYVRSSLDEEYFEPHVPMAVRGVYSDFFYRLHSCRSFALPEAWKDRGNVDRISYKDLDVVTFVNLYEKPNVPLVVEGAVMNWRAFHKWQDIDYIRQQVGDRSFRSTSGAAPLPCNFTISSFQDYCQSTSLEEAPLYLFDRTALSPGSPLWNDYFPDLQSTCSYWDPENDASSHDLFKVLGEERRPDHTWLIIGAKRSGSVFHIDPNATHAWNAVIRGRKR
jgi:hypothetical protein